MTTGASRNPAHQVLYRKWRPQTLEQVVGQEHITRTLLNALGQDRVGHAYLFTGPRGTGKTSTARILAKAINCETTGGTGEPCNVCGACREITDASFLDLVEIDGASNRGIDEIRDLREKVRFMPARGRKKVYIIDEVHMLTAAAFNALLKTLEEPPDHVVFLLATTEPHAVPLTIASRCQRFDFRRIPEEDATTLLGGIAEAEGFSMDSEALQTVVKASGGSLRDAENLLEQLALTAGVDASANDARRIFGVTGSNRARDLIEALMVEKDLAAALRGLSALQAAGVDMRQIHRELVNEMRTLLLVRAGAADVLDLSVDDLNDRRRQADRIELPVIRHALGQLAPLNVASGSPPLLLEIAFAGISIAGTAPVPTPENDRGEALAQAEAGTQSRPLTRSAQTAAQPGRPPTRPAQPARPASPAENTPGSPRAESPPSQTLDFPPERGVSGQVARRQGEQAPDAPLIAGDGELTFEMLQERWKDLVDGLRGVGSSGNVDAYLRSVSRPIAIENNDTIVIGFSHDFHKNKIDDPKYRHLVEQRFAQLLGKHYTIRCEKVDKEEARGHLVRAAQAQGAQVIGGGESADDGGPDQESGG